MQYDLIDGRVRVFQRVSGPNDDADEATLLRDIAAWIEGTDVTPLTIVLDNQWQGDEESNTLLYSAMVSYDAAHREPTSGQGPFGDGHEVRFGNVCNRAQRRYWPTEAARALLHPEEVEVLGRSCPACGDVYGAHSLDALAWCMDQVYDGVDNEFDPDTGDFTLRQTEVVRDPQGRVK